MKLNKPKFWDERISFLSIILYPLTLLVIFFIFLRKIFCSYEEVKIPVICVGNIYIGGTGKTPTSIYLAKELLKLKKKPALIRKYYKDHNDEYDLIEKNFNGLILNKNRLKAIKDAEYSKYNVAILDDGLQDYRIKKNLNIVCFNQKQQIGNGLIIPSGPLREGLSALKFANIVLINGAKNKDFEEKIFKINSNLKIFYSFYKPLNIQKFKNSKLLAIAAIGNPNNFFNLMEENELIIKKKLVFPDHYLFSEIEIRNILAEAKLNNYKIITTEKDYYKFKRLNCNFDYLEISLEIKEKEKFLHEVQKIL